MSVSDQTLQEASLLRSELLSPYNNRPQPYVRLQPNGRAVLFASEGRNPDFHQSAVMVLWAANFLEPFRVTDGLVDFKVVGEYL